MLKIAACTFPNRETFGIGDDNWDTVYVSADLLFQLCL